jgi:hypothetical protein
MPDMLLGIADSPPSSRPAMPDMLLGIADSPSSSRPAMPDNCIPLPLGGVKDQAESAGRLRTITPVVVDGRRHARGMLRMRGRP